MKRLFITLSLLTCSVISFSQADKYTEVQNQVISNPPKVKVKNSNYLMNFEHNGNLIFVRGVSAKAGQGAYSSMAASMNAFTKFIVDVFTKDFKLVSSNYVSGILENEKEGLLSKTSGVLSYQHVGNKIVFFPVEFSRSDYTLTVSVISYDLSSKKLSNREKLFTTKDFMMASKCTFDMVENNSKVLFSYSDGDNSKYMLIDENMKIDKDTEVRVDQSVDFILQNPLEGKVAAVFNPSKGEFDEVEFDFGVPAPIVLNSMNTEGAGGVGTSSTYTYPIPNIIHAYGNKNGVIDIIGMEYDQSKKSVGPKFIQYNAANGSKSLEVSNPVLKGFRSMECRGLESIGDDYVFLAENIVYKETGIAYPNYKTIAVCGIGADGKVKWTNKIDRTIQENYIVATYDVGFKYLVKDDKIFLFYKSGAESKKTLKSKDLDGIYLEVFNADGKTEKVKVVSFEDANQETMNELKFTGNCFIDSENNAIYFVGIVKNGTSITRVKLK